MTKELNKEASGTNQELLLGKELEAIIFHTSHLRVNRISFRHEQEELSLSNAVNYLHIWLDDNIIFVGYVNKAKEKTEMCYVRSCSRWNCVKFWYGE